MYYKNKKYKGRKTKKKRSYKGARHGTKTIITKYRW